jgi:hypothetical protein
MTRAPAVSIERNPDDSRANRRHHGLPVAFTGPARVAWGGALAHVTCRLFHRARCGCRDAASDCLAHPVPARPGQPGVGAGYQTDPDHAGDCGPWLGHLDSVLGDRSPWDSVPDDLLLGPSVFQSCVPRQASGAIRTGGPRPAAPSRPSRLRRCARAGAALTGPADSGESLGCAPRRGTSGPGTGKAAPQPGRGVSLSGVGRDARRLRQGLGRAQIGWRSRRWW